MQQLVDEKRHGAQALTALRDEPERFLATVQIGITIVGTTAAAFGGSTIAVHLEPIIGAMPWLARHAEEIAFAAVVASISYLSLVLGELVPKSLALRVGETYALLMARPLLTLAYVAKPLVWLLTVSSNVVLRPFRDRTNFMEARISKEEIQQMVDEAGKAGTLHEHASEIASRVLDFDKLPLRDAMIPRDRIDALPKSAAFDEIRTFLLEERRSRVPIYEGTLDNIVGYVSAKDIVSIAWEGKLVVIDDILRPMKYFPETMLAVEVLRYMRREHQRIVIAVDEHGVVSGLVTFEDLVEELVGDVFSEHEEDAQAIVQEADGTVVVRGETPIRDVNRALDLALEESEGATTIAGLCAQLGGGIPNRNARLAASGGTTLVVLDASPRTVRRVRIIRAPATPEITD